MPLTIVRQDITNMEVDAVVNAANTQLAMGGGVCGAIFQAAGAEALQEACKALAPIQTGEAAVTAGFGLNASYIIHAVGPIFDPCKKETCRRLLASAYTSALRLAAGKGCSSVAFPLISSGIFGYPKEEALQVALSAIRAFLEEEEMEVYLTVFDRASFAVSRALLGEVQAHIDQVYADTHMHLQASMAREMPVCSVADRAPTELEQQLAHLDEPFNTALLRLIDAKGKLDTEVYKRANIDRKLFSKIRTGKNYTPGKRTVLALAVSLELSLEETDALLEKAGYSLSHSKKFDVIVEYFILRKNYDIDALNAVLFAYDQPLLGASA